MRPDETMSINLTRSEKDYLCDLLDRSVNRLHATNEQSTADKPYQAKNGGAIVVGKLSANVQTNSLLR